MSAKKLNDMDHMRRVDKGDMLSFCASASEQVRRALESAHTVSINYSKPETILVGGVGGSAIGGELLEDWAKDKITIPVKVCRSYSLPKYANEESLVVIVSYSGETEEALSMFLDAIRRDCMILSITSGGKLLHFTKMLNLPHFRVPPGIPPRAALPYLFIPMLILLEKVGLISGVNHEIHEAIETLEQVAVENGPENAVECNLSKMLALKIKGTIPIVYGFGIYRAVALRFKQQLNENSKVPSKWDFLPELDHNEIMGWEAPARLLGGFSTIFFRDSREREEMRRRIEVTSELIRRMTKNVFDVWSVGEGRLARMLSSINIGDFSSVYLAILQGVDPTPVGTITLLKSRLTENGMKEKLVGELETFLKQKGLDREI